VCSVLAPGSIESGGGIGQPGDGLTSECDGNVLEGTKTQGRNGFQQLATAAETTDSLVEQRLEGAHLNPRPLRRGKDRVAWPRVTRRTQSGWQQRRSSRETFHRAGAILVMAS
jgi:hypothetical protein